MTATKRKISVSLDENLIAELEAGGEALSGQINEAVRAEIERRRRQRPAAPRRTVSEHSGGAPALSRAVFVRVPVLNNLQSRVKGTIMGGLQDCGELRQRIGTAVAA